MERIWDVEPLQQHGGVALRRVAVLLADDAFELAEAHAVLVRHVGASIERVSLGQRGPEPLIAHDDGVDHAILVEGVVILTQHAEFAGTDDRPALWVEVSRQQLHEGGLARAVRAGEPIATPRRKRRRDVLEQDLRAVTHGHTTDSNHERGSLNGEFLARVNFLF